MKRRKIIIARSSIIKGAITKSLNNTPSHSKWYLPACITDKDMAVHGDLIFNSVVKRGLCKAIYRVLKLTKKLNLSSDTLFMGLIEYIKVVPHKVPIKLIDMWVNIILYLDSKNINNEDNKQTIEKSVRLAIDCRFYDRDGPEYYLASLINILLFGDMHELYDTIYGCSLIMSDPLRIRFFKTILSEYGHYLNTEDEIDWKPPYSDDYRSSGLDDPIAWISQPAEALNLGDFLVKICTESAYFCNNEIFFSTLCTHIFNNGSKIQADLVLTEKSARRLHRVMDSFLTYLLFDFKKDFYEILFESRSSTGHWMYALDTKMECIKYAVPFFNVWAKRYWSTKVREYNWSLKKYDLSELKLLTLPRRQDLDRVNSRIENIVKTQIYDLICLNDYILNVYFNTVTEGEWFKDNKTLDEQLEEMANEIKGKIPDKYLRNYLMTFV